MTDMNGKTPDDAEFYELDDKTWICVGYGKCKITKTKVEDIWIYQKIADADNIPYYKSSVDRLNVLTYKQWREFMTGKKWIEIIEPLVRQIKVKGEQT